MKFPAVEASLWNVNRCSHESRALICVHTCRCCSTDTSSACPFFLVSPEPVKRQALLASACVLHSLGHHFTLYSSWRHIFDRSIYCLFITFFLLECSSTSTWFSIVHTVHLQASRSAGKCCFRYFTVSTPSTRSLYACIIIALRLSFTPTSFPLSPLATGISFT